MWKTMEYTAIGSSHLKAGLPCQDKVCSYRDKEVTVIAVADGAGTARLSHYGAEAVLKDLSKEVGEHFEEYFEENDPIAMRWAIYAKIRETLEKTQVKLECELKDLSSTFLLVAVSGFRYLVIHMGDGVIGYLKEGEIRVASAPDNGEFANETFFTTSLFSLEKMRIFKGEDAEIHGFVLMSDGPEQALYHKQTGKLSQGIKRIMHMMTLCPEHAMKELLAETFEDVILNHTQDDCSMAVLTRTDAFPCYDSMSDTEKLELLQIGKEARNRKKRMNQTGKILVASSTGASAYELAWKIHVRPKHIYKKLDYLMSLGLLEKKQGFYYSVSNGENIHSKNQLNVKESNKMEKMRKTGIIAAGTITVAGLALGAAPATAQAAETGDENISVQANAKAQTSQSVNEAKAAANAAQTDAEKADAAVEEAQTKVAEAQQKVEHASEAADSARNEADQAFESAKSDAEQADENAKKELETAENKVTEADSKVEQAKDDVANAKENLESAENKVDEAINESPVTEEDIASKESEVKDAESALEDAETKVTEAEDAKEKAESVLSEKESARDTAGEEVKKAEAEKNSADTAVSGAEKALEEATEELQSAEDLKNGKLNIEDTAQYKKEQETKESLDKATAEKNAAAKEAETAGEKEKAAEEDVQTAEKELESAAKELNSKEQAISEAGETKEKADSAKDKAQETYDTAYSDTTLAAENVNKAENAVTNAKSDVKTAEEAKSAADEAVKTATDALNTAKKEAEAAVDADIASAEKELANKKTAVETAKTALDKAEENYKQGTLGFIDYMLKKENLTEKQIRDLTYAREVLVNASEEDFSQWYGGDNTGLPEERNGKVVVIGDSKDATSLENLLKSIEIMKKINELRASDDNFTGVLQRSDSYTNFYFMATAEAGANRGAGLKSHSSLTTSCENLAFGYSDPTLGWYNKEKAIFDGIKNELGIKQITSMEDVSKIAEEAEKRGYTVGHYTNLFWAADQVMGVGYTQYSRTSCYNASAASNYTNEQNKRSMHVYTISEFEQLVKEYYQTVNASSCKEALSKAEAEQTAAEKSLQTLKDGKDSAVESAIKTAKADLTAKETEAKEAEQKLALAKASLASAEKALERADAEKTAAEQSMTDAKDALDKAKTDCKAADANYANAEEERDAVKERHAELEGALKDAVAMKKSAASLYEEKQAALAEAEKALGEAANAHEEAAKKLADLTSEGTIKALQEQKQQAESNLQTAKEERQAKADALKVAEDALAQAETEVAKAKDSLQKAEENLTDADAARDAAKDAADTANLALTNLRKLYAPVSQAIADRDASRIAVSQAEDALAIAESDLAKAKERLSKAVLAKAETADKLVRATGLSVEKAMEALIDDSDFAYLNDYIAAIKTADTQLAAAASDLQVATAELEDRQADKEEAQKAYIAALVDLTIAQNQAGGFGEKNSTSAFEGDYVITASTNTAWASVTQPEDNSHVLRSSSVKTGDRANVMAWLAELLAGMGLITLVYRLRRREE